MDSIDQFIPFKDERDVLRIEVIVPLKMACEIRIPSVERPPSAIEPLDYEKIRIIREKRAIQETEESRKALELLEDHLKSYEISSLESIPAEKMLMEGKSILEQISKQNM